MEFDQLLLTCRNSLGYSRIDRIYTSLMHIVIGSTDTAANLLNVPTDTSDHLPVSAKLLQCRNALPRIPTWAHTGGDTSGQ